MTRYSGRLNRLERATPFVRRRDGDLRIAGVKLSEIFGLLRFEHDASEFERAHYELALQLRQRYLDGDVEWTDDYLCGMPGFREMREELVAHLQRGRAS